MNIEGIALFDMDGTLCDYNTGLLKELEKIKSSYESPIVLLVKEDPNEYTKKEWNKDFRHPNVISYNDANLAEVEEAMKKAKERR